MTANANTGSKILTSEELLRRAVNMVPTLKSRAAHTEELRRIPDETIQEFLSAGLNRIEVPIRFGGLEVDYDLVFEVAVELARGCPSSSWCFSVWAANAGMVGYWPLQAQEEVYAEGPDILCSSSLTSGTSKTEPVSGGYRLTGRWEFSSGCDSASWLILGVAGIGERTWVLVPRQDFEIVDTWFVSGLRGTGSKDIVVEDVFVPTHRVLDVVSAGNGNWTGWEIHGAAYYRIPIPVSLGWDLVAPMVGIAQGMIDEFTARLIGTTGPGKTAESPAIQVRLSEATAAVDAGRVFMRHDIHEIFEKANRAETFTPLERARYRRDKAFISQLCLRSVNRLFDLSGGHALFDSVALQRFHRDAHAVAHRDGLIMDLGGQQYGKVVLGLEPEPGI
ncbi:MAG: acyl-CoA dehydrogenase family protein [Dehalococcoidia bacterium]